MYWLWSSWNLAFVITISGLSFIGVKLELRNVYIDELYVILLFTRTDEMTSCRHPTSVSC